MLQSKPSLSRRACTKALLSLVAGACPLLAQSELAQSDGPLLTRPDRVTSPEKPPQKPADEPVIHVDVELVNLFFTVRRQKSGELVPTLNQNDFQIFEDGQPQQILRFSKESNLPLELGLLIDVSRSQINLIETEREAGATFLSSVIRPKDEAFLLSFGHDTDLVQDFTNSVPRLKAALNTLKGDSGPSPSGQGRSGGGYPGSGGSGYPGGGFPFPGGGGRYPGGGHRGGQGGQPPNGSMKGTLLFDAVYLACTDEINHKTGRKALILVTDGGDRGSYYRRDQAVEAAQRADTIIYSVYYVDRRAYGRAGRSDDDDGLENLQRMSVETGGRVFKVGNDHTLEDIFTDIQAEMRSLYSIGYKSTNPNRNGEFRLVAIRTKNPDFAVQGRKGYYATKTAAAS